MIQLPESNIVDVASLAGIFKRTTNSYKFLFFQALLRLLEKKKFKKDTFSFRELEEEIIVIVKYSINVCKLNFGTQDQVATKLASNDLRSLMTYVPYRLLTPFFSDELRGKKDGDKNKMIKKLSKNVCKGGGHSIYKIEDERVELYPEWTQYFKEHFAIIDGWASWHWVNYLQNKNPNAINLIRKLQKPIKRSPLSYQRNYWGEILNHQRLNCIYSNKPISKTDFVLDHFLPWSFIGHDQLWNLIPVNKKVNSEKSDNIPSVKYLDKFIDIQIIGLQSKKITKRCKDDFLIGLNVDFSDLTDEEKIKERYCETIKPLADIANNMGFHSNWEYIEKDKSINLTI